MAVFLPSRLSASCTQRSSVSADSPFMRSSVRASSASSSSNMPRTLSLAPWAAIARPSTSASLLSSFVSSAIALSFGRVPALAYPNRVEPHHVRVSLFVTCFNDTLFPRTGQAVVTLLERLGCELDFPLEQTCCGQMHMNSGYPREGLALAQRFARVFEGADAVVCPSASCAGMLRHQLAPGEGPPVYELSELLIDQLGVEDVGAYFPHRVTYHPTCHSLRELEVGERPLRLLRAVRGIELVELPQASECCGFGGTFAVKNAEVSSAMVTDKVRAVLDTGAEVICAADNSCLMQIGGALSRQDR